MPLVAAAVCPHPPLIVPELAGAAAGELDDLRAACDAAVAGLYASGARTVVVVGAGDRTAELSHPFRGSFAPWGLPLEVQLGTPTNGGEYASSGGEYASSGGESGHLPAGDECRPAGGGDLPAVGDGDDPRVAGAGDQRLPLSLLVGAWLLRRTPPDHPTTWRMVSVASDAPTGECAAAGARIGSARQPWALLVMGDGSACRGPKSPGYADPRAEAYDGEVARALAGADAEALLGLDPVLSAQLKVAGRAAWQVLGGAVRAAGGDWRGELSHQDAPYGVAYFVANWVRA